MQTNGKILFAQGLEELILLKCPCYQKQATNLMQYFFPNTNIFHRTRTNNPKISMEPQKITVKVILRRTKLEVSQSQISKHTTKL